eukprot:scaffold44749_cov64-Phaeocystis_antarctica.AAC.1
MQHTGRWLVLGGRACSVFCAYPRFASGSGSRGSTVQRAAAEASPTWVAGPGALRRGRPHARALAHAYALPSRAHVASFYAAAVARHLALQWGGCPL